MDKEQETILSYIRDYEDFPTDQLRALYQEVAELTTDQEQDPYLQAALLQLLEQADPAPQEDSTAALTAFLEENPLSNRFRQTRRCPRIRPLVAVVILLVALLIAAGAYSAYTILFSLDGEIGIGVKADVMRLDTPSENGYSTLEEMLADNDLPPLGPSWMPEGYSLRTLTLQRENNDSHITFAAWYAPNQSEDGIKLIITHFLQGIPDSYMLAYEKDDGYHAAELPDGTRFYTYENGETSGAVLEISGENAVCSIFGPITENKIKQIVNSISTKENEHETH